MREKCKGCIDEFKALVQSNCLKCERFPKEKLKDYYVLKD